jgi:amidase
VRLSISPFTNRKPFFILGDCHARQGDGELGGVAVEMAATVTIGVDLIKNWRIVWPRLENERLIMTIGSARPMEDAARIAYRELIHWLVEDYHWDKLEAYFFLTQAGRLRVGNMVDPKYALGGSEILPRVRSGFAFGCCRWVPSAPRPRGKADQCCTSSP